MRGEVYGPGGGGRQATVAKAACGVEGSTADWEQGTGRSARKVEDVAHGCSSEAFGRLATQEDMADFDSAPAVCALRNTTNGT